MRYTLPELPYPYDALVPHISEEQLRIHHQKHHQAYVNNANAILDKLEQARKNGEDIDIGAKLKEFSFQLAGHLLHSAFWPGMIADSMEEPRGALADQIKKDFGSFDRFKKEFSAAASSVEGSGWAILTYCVTTGKLMFMQIEKHNVNIIPNYPLLLVLDVWEHAYYLDYKNERPEFIHNFWAIVNWNEIEKRFDEVRR